MKLDKVRMLSIALLDEEKKDWSVIEAQICFLHIE